MRNTFKAFIYTLVVLLLFMLAIGGAYFIYIIVILSAVIFTFFTVKFLLGKLS